ncbi:MAG: hypothetical protein AAGF24_01750 [Cyanobacteria bacterium P01_H01_bin.121]
MNWKHDLVIMSGVMALWCGANVLIDQTLQAPGLKMSQPSDRQDPVPDEDVDPEADNTKDAPISNRSGSFNSLLMPIPGQVMRSARKQADAEDTASSDATDSATDGATDGATEQDTTTARPRNTAAKTATDTPPTDSDLPITEPVEPKTAIAMSSNQLLNLSQTSLFQSAAGELLAYNLDQICLEPQPVTDQAVANSTPEAATGSTVIIYALRTEAEAETLLLGSATFAAADCTAQHRYVDAERELSFDYKGRFQDVSSSPQVEMESCTGTVYVRSHSSTHKTLAWAIEPTAACSYSGYSSHDLYKRS